VSARSVLITGAGGFAGGALATGFTGLGWDVIGIDRAFDDSDVPGGFDRIVADLGRDGVPGSVPRVDLFVHGAWVSADPATLGITEDEYVARNVGALRAAAEYAAHRRPSAFVFISSSGVFAATDAVDGLTDDCEATGSSPYAVAKRVGERLARAELDGITDVHVVRLGYLYGPGEVARASRPGVSLVAAWIAAAREGEALAVREDDPEREWTFVGDLATALERVVSQPARDGPLHLGSPHVIRDRAFAEMIAQGFPGTGIIPVPAGPAVKPPMIPSDIPPLHGFEWTDPETGLEALLGKRVAR
jgi:nucleoside-diphosphate-sugar epimerase